MTEGTVVKWKKKEGDKIKAGEEIAEVETDKATMPMESFEGGTLAFIAAKEGDKVQVGGLIGVIARSNENIDDIRKQYAGGAKSGATASTKPAASAAGTPPKPTVTLSGPAVVNKGNGVVVPPSTATGGAATYAAAAIGEMHEPVEAQAHGPTRSRVDRSPAAIAQRAGNAGPHPNRIFATPIARRIAAEHNLDLSALEGTGPGGRIVQKDVMTYIEQGGTRATPTRPTASAVGTTPQPSPMPVLSGQTRVIPMTKIRTAIATALQRSKQQIPHFYETIDIDMEAINALRERLNERLEKEKVRLSIMDFIYKGVAGALLRHPALNARFNAERGEITQYGDVNLGIAVAIPDGLIVPVLRGINQMGLRDIRLRTTDLFDRARAQRLKREEQSEATFSITALGTYGIRDFSAIINPPEVGILAVGAAEKRAVVRDGEIVARSTMSVTLSCDHRVVDGATAAEFLRTLKEILEEPGMLLV
jgi:pyruvate dehydrogenase E2 component (dihydrolipoamide acetyltransferase)